MAAAFCLLVLAYVTLGTWASGSVCIQLPNGLLLGREALVDPYTPYWQPNVILKYPDGTPVLSDWVDSFYFTETTVWGGTLNGVLKGLGGDGRDHPAYRESVFFAYRPDAGLVYLHEDPDTYERLKQEAGQIIWVLGPEVHTNLLGTFLKLVEDPASRRKFCPLPILPDRRRGVH
ncbi:hypothetical protein V3328_16565 [Microbaculum marinum]|uniref:Uncharacterized protein n=2 Tax=Microbaculum marinum TaxID=1764581 RepID=A0AAW9RLL6_9HYPH